MQGKELGKYFSCPQLYVAQVLAESGCVTADCRIDLYFGDR